MALLLCNRLGGGVFRSNAMFYAVGPAGAVRLRRELCGHGTDARGGQSRQLSGLSREDKKGKITSAWNSSAEAYVGAVQERGQGGGLAAGMSVGYKLAARLVNSLSNKRCEAAATAGNNMCRARATHGEAKEAATACELHKTEGMVRLKEPGSATVLDVASAGGEPAITIAKVLPDATVHATDIAPAMVELIRRRATEAGVSNVTAAVADGESLAEFGDGSVDAVTCTWGLMFMPDWKRAVQEFSRVLRSDGLVMITLWERHEDSIYQRMAAVLNTLSPGFKGLIDPEALGGDGGSAVAEEMEAAGLDNVTISKFSAPVLLEADGGPRDIWKHCALSTPLGQTLSSLEAKGREGVRQEALEIFENQMNKDWAEGRTPLGLAKEAERDPSVPPPPRVFYVRALAIVGHKKSG